MESWVGEEEVDKWFGKLLLDAGWEVRRNPRTNELRVMSDMFGGEGGYTASAILGASSALVRTCLNPKNVVNLHSYPEKKFGIIAEVEFNLCYFEPEVVRNHASALEKSEISFFEAFESTGSLRSDSDKRYLS
ncbi:MAG: hypothetical protein Q8R25_00475 [bacterium]|nr:hypothetical protein [bacterium]